MATGGRFARRFATSLCRGPSAGTARSPFRVRGRGRFGKAAPTLSPSPPLQPKSDVSDFGQSLSGKTRVRVQAGERAGRACGEALAPQWGPAADVICHAVAHHRYAAPAK